MSRQLLAFVATAFLATSSRLPAQTGFWSPVENLGRPVNTPNNELAGVFADSGRMIYFARTEVGQNDLLVSRLEAGSWSRPSPLLNLNTAAYNETNPTLSRDGQRLYFASDRPGGRGGFDIWVSHLVGGSWSYPEPLGANINSDADEWYAAEGPEGLYLAARRASGLNRGDILYGRGSFPEFSLVVPVTGLASQNREMSAFPSPDGHVLYVTAERPDGVGLDDVWEAHGWGGDFARTFMTECNISGSDFDQYPAVGPDGSQLLYASSGGQEGEGGFDLYVADWHALGDMNGDLRASTADIIYLVNHLFSAGPPPSDPLVADPNCDGTLGLVDVVILVNYILRGGEAPCVDCPR